MKYQFVKAISENHKNIIHLLFYTHYYGFDMTYCIYIVYIPIVIILMENKYY